MEEENMLCRPHLVGSGIDDDNESLVVRSASVSANALFYFEEESFIDYQCAG
jgi:hypothetical protein